MKILLLSVFLALTVSSFSFANYTMFGPPLTVSVTGTSTQALAQNGLRTYLLIVNTGANTIIVKFGSAQSGTEGVPIPPGGNYEPSKAPANSVFLETASSTSTASIIQGQ